MGVKSIFVYDYIIDMGMFRSIRKTPIQHVMSFILCRCFGAASSSLTVYIWRSVGRGVGDHKVQSMIDKLFFFVVFAGCFVFYIWCATGAVGFVSALFFFIGLGVAFALDFFFGGIFIYQACLITIQVSKAVKLSGGTSNKMQRALKRLTFWASMS